MTAKGRIAAATALSNNFGSRPIFPIHYNGLRDVPSKNCFFPMLESGPRYNTGFLGPAHAQVYIPSDISRLLERLPRTSQTTVAFCLTLVVAHCAPTPMTRGSCSCREHITNSVIGVSRPPVLDCGTTFHLDYGGRDLPSTPSGNL